VSTRHNIFARIVKAEAQADGTVIVEGIASSGTRDVDGEIVTPAAMKAALPDYMKFPAVREMHANWAAGKTVQARVDDGDGCTYIRAKVVDKDACQKVREGVYAGFSIGGHVPEGGRNKDDQSIIEAINLVEISLVDRPANPDACIQLFKAASAVKERTVDLPKDEAAQKAAAAQALKDDADKKAAAAKAAKPTKKAAPGPVGGMSKDDMLAMANRLYSAALACKDDDSGDVAAADGDSDDVAAGDDVAADDGGGSDDNMTAADDVDADDDVAAGDDVDADDDVAAAAKAKLKKRAQSDALLKQTSDLLAKVTAQNKSLAKKNAELEVKLKTKGVLKRVPVAKEDDVDEAKEDDELKKAAEAAARNPSEAAAMIVKMVHARGGMTR
jgi:hypothetical protein